MHRSNPYPSYLLHLWCEHRDGISVWRASLESTLSGERCGFSTLQTLFKFLSAEVATM